MTKRLLLLVLPLLLLSTAFAAVAAAPGPRDNPSTPPPPNCMGDLFGNKKLNCTANDVEVTQYYLVAGPKECAPGQAIKVKLQAKLLPNAAQRYAIGLYVAKDGGDAIPGSCFHDYLPDPLLSSGYNPGSQFDPGQPSV